MSKKVSEEESKKDVVSLINSLNDNGVLYFYYISLISSDSLMSVEDCEIAEKQMLEFQEALPKTNVKNTEKLDWPKLIEDGLNVIRRDKEFFQNNK
jgi:hypothetical protein